MKISERYFFFIVDNKNLILTLFFSSQRKMLRAKDTFELVNDILRKGGIVTNDNEGELLFQLDDDFQTKRDKLINLYKIVHLRTTEFLFVKGSILWTFFEESDDKNVFFRDACNMLDLCTDSIRDYMRFAKVYLIIYKNGAKRNVSSIDQAKRFENEWINKPEYHKHIINVWKEVCIKKKGYSISADYIAYTRRRYNQEEETFNLTPRGYKPPNRLNQSDEPDTMIQTISNNQNVISNDSGPRKRHRPQNHPEDGYQNDSAENNKCWRCNKEISFDYTIASKDYFTCLDCARFCIEKVRDMEQ